jgi:hypothetical protein
MPRIRGVVIGEQGRATNKGLVKREVREEMALRVRMLNGRHVQDALERLEAELADRAHIVSRTTRFDPRWTAGRRHTSRRRSLPGCPWSWP